MQPDRPRHDARRVDEHQGHVPAWAAWPVSTLHIDMWGGCCATWETHLDEIARNVHTARDTVALQS